MAIDSYDNLQTTVAKFLKRADLTALIPDFIMLAETKLNRRLRTAQQRTSFTVTPSSQNVSIPSDSEEIYRVLWNGATLPFISDNFSATNAAVSQCNFGYSIEGTKLVLQVPQLGSQLVIQYFQELEALSDTNTSNWLLEDQPDIYLYATLLEASLYVRDDDRTTLWGGLLEQIVSDFEESDKRSQRPNQALVMKAR